MRNILFHGDALHLPRVVGRGQAQLAYLDPPYNVGVTFGARTKVSETRARGASAGPVAYEDRFASLEAYLQWLAPRLEATWSLLGNEGSLWLHLDQRTVHDAKVLCDKLFGPNQFWGEVIWVPGNGSKARKGPGMTHQTILLYARGDEPLWNREDPVLREPYAPTSLAMHFRSTDEEGRAFRERTVAGRTYRYYADEGRALGSVWADCPAMVANTPLRKETTGYPTQKPRKLLERIVRAASREGDLVVDPFFGSGTTLEAAGLLGRRFVGADIGDLAQTMARKRLEAAGLTFESLEAPSPVPRLAKDDGKDLDA